jgi:hypothetical protein
LSEESAQRTITQESRSLTACYEEGLALDARLDDIDVLFTDQPPPPPFDDLMAQGDVECVLCGADPDIH